MHGCCWTSCHASHTQHPQFHQTLDQPCPTRTSYWQSCLSTGLQPLLKSQVGMTISISYKRCTWSSATVPSWSGTCYQMPALTATFGMQSRQNSWLCTSKRIQTRQPAQTCTATRIWYPKLLPKGPRDIWEDVWGQACQHWDGPKCPCCYHRRPHHDEVHQRHGAILQTLALHCQPLWQPAHEHCQDWQGHSTREHEICSRVGGHPIWQRSVFVKRVAIGSAKLKDHLCFRIILGASLCCL